MAIDFSELNKVLFPNKDKGNIEEIFKNFTSPSGKDLIRNLGNESGDIEIQRLCTKLCNEKKVDGQTVVSVKNSEDLFYRLKKLANLLKDSEEEYDETSSFDMFVKNLNDSYGDWESTKDDDTRSRLELVKIVEEVWDCIFLGGRVWEQSEFKKESEKLRQNVAKFRARLKEWCGCEYWQKLMNSPEGKSLKVKEFNPCTLAPMSTDITNIADALSVVHGDIEPPKGTDSKQINVDNMCKLWMDMSTKWACKAKEDRVGKVIKLVDDKRLTKIMGRMAATAKSTAEDWENDLKLWKDREIERNKKINQGKIGGKSRAERYADAAWTRKNTDD